MHFKLECLELPLLSPSLDGIVIGIERYQVVSLGVWPDASAEQAIRDRLT
jgi:hypothetical protein